MKKIRKVLILLIIIIMISLTYILFQTINKKTDKTVTIATQGQEDINNSEKLNIEGKIKNRSSRKYSVELNINNDYCIKAIENADTGESLLDNIDSRDVTLNLDTQLHSEYPIKIVMANGEIIEKDFLVDTIIPREEGIQIDVGTPVKDSNGYYTFPNLDIINVFDDDISTVIVQFVSAISSGDQITLYETGNVKVNTTPSFSYANVSNMTTEEIISYIKDNLKIKINPSNQNEHVGIKIGLDDEEINLENESNIAYYCTDTGHYYKYIKSSGITWANAKVAAEKETYYGRHGYLATITSQSEEKFMYSLIDGLGWLGGTCDYNYIYDTNGNKIYSNINQSLWNWYWVTGPEAGTKFWDRNGYNLYSNWASGEPNNAGNEYYLHTYATGLWNDFANSNSSISGYIVEFGGMNTDEEIFNISLGETEVYLDT